MGWVARGGLPKIPSISSGLLRHAVNGGWFEEEARARGRHSDKLVAAAVKFHCREGWGAPLPPARCTFAAACMADNYGRYRVGSMDRVEVATVSKVESALARRPP